MPSSYRGDPYWTEARFASACSKCGAGIRKGEPIFYYPRGKKVLCGVARSDIRGHNSCGFTADHEFRAAVADEDFYNRTNPKRRRRNSAPTTASAWRSSAGSTGTLTFSMKCRRADGPTSMSARTPK